MAIVPCSIPSNPDVSGIGVRAAVYTQNLTCFLPIILDLWDRKISRNELKGIKDQSIGMLTVAFAILFTTIILAKGAGGNQTITSYHAAVVLNLSWMNNTSTWIWFILYVHSQSKRDDRPTGANWSEWCDTLLAPLLELLNGRNEGENAEGTDEDGPLQSIVQRIWRFIFGQPVLTLGSVHLLLMAAVGIWLWNDPSEGLFSSPASTSFLPSSSSSLCISYITGHGNGINRSGQGTRLSRLRSIQNVFTASKSPSSSDSEQDFLSDVTTEEPRPPHTAFLIVGLVFLVSINILFIIDIELTLRRNKSNQNGDDEWGFGQVLALLLLVIPLCDAWNAAPLQEIREALNGVQEQFEELLRRECQAMPVVDELKRLMPTNFR